MAIVPDWRAEWHHLGDPPGQVDDPPHRFTPRDHPERILDLGDRPGEHAFLPRIDGVKMGVNYGGNKTRFLSPVRAGKRVRSHTKLLELVEKRPGQWQQTNEVTIEIEGEDKPALICEWITLFFV